MNASTLDDAVFNPDKPEHFFVLRPVGRRVTVLLRGAEMAVSDNAQWLLESGKSLYAPVIYLPKADTSVPVAKVPGNTHCPLKGDATYYIREGDGRILKVAWAYDEPYDWATSLAGLIAFDPALCRFELEPK